MSKAVKALSVILILAALFGLVGGGLSVKDALDSKSYYEKKGEETDANFKKLDDGINQLEENDQKYHDGKAQYEEGKKQYEEGKEKLADAEKQLADGKKTLDENKDAYESGKVQLADAAKQLQKGRQDLAAGKQQLDAGEALFAKTLNDQKNAAAQEAAGVDYSQLPPEAQQQIDAGVNQKIEQAAQVNSAVKSLMQQGLTEDQAVNTVAQSQVTAEVEKNNDAIVAGVTAAVRQNVEQQVRAGAEAKKPEYREAAAQNQAGVSYDQLPPEAQAQIDAAVDKQIEEAIPGMVDQQMQSEQVQAIIAENVANQKESLIQQNMPAAVELVKTAVSTTESIQALQKGRSDYAAGAQKLAAGEQQYNAGAAKLKEYEDGLAKYEDGMKQYEEGKKTLEDAEKQLADAEEQLAEFEDGRAALIDGLNIVMEQEDEGITSVADRLDKGFSFMRDDTDIDYDAARKVVKAGRGFSSDSGDMISKEIWTRVYGTVAGMVGSLLGLLAGVLGLKNKFKGSGVTSILTALLGAGNLGALVAAGSKYSEQAGASAITIALAAAGILACAALLNGIASFGANKKANV